MPVKKFKDPLAPPPTQSIPPSGQYRIGLKTSESPARSETEPPQKQRHYPNGNKGWKALEVRHQNIREKLKGNWNTLSSSIMDWVLETDEDGNQVRLQTLLKETKLKDIGVMLGIATEKVLLLDGQPTQIVGTAEQKKLEELLPALMNEVKRRGATVELTERKAEIKVPATQNVS
jgi:hypothetical protein